MLDKDPEYNRPGMKGFHARTPRKKKQTGEEVGAWLLVSLASNARSPYVDTLPSVPSVIGRTTSGSVYLPEQHGNRQKSARGL